MTEKDPFADRRRGHEEEYFRKRDQELIAKMRRREAEQATRQLMVEQTGITNDAAIEELQALGYTPETVPLLYVVPLLQTAWIDGSLSTGERELIVEAARGRAIDAGSAADRTLAEWLETPPSDEQFDAALRAIGEMLQTRPADERATTVHEILASCTAVASASGGVLGFGRVSEAEQRLLDRIKSALEP